jgi:hypothetical protein
MRIRHVSIGLVLLGAFFAGCGAEEPMPAFPPPIATADETEGGDLDSLDEAPAEEESTEAAAPERRQAH